MAMSPDFIAELLDRSASAIADQTAILQVERDPALRDRFGPRCLESIAEDTRTRISFLSEAVALAEPSVFTAQVTWARSTFLARAVDADHLRDNLRCLRDILVDRLPAEPGAACARTIDHALGALDAPPTDIPSSIEGDAPLDRLTRRYLLALLEADRAAALGALVDQARAGTPVADLYERVIVPAHREIGRMWQLGEATVAEEHYATAAAEWILPQVSALAHREPPDNHRALATTADGDTHTLGLRLVSDALEFAGWSVYYLGASTPTPDVIQSLFDQRSEVLVVSVSLGCHLRSARALIRAVREVPEVRHVPVLVGGSAISATPGIWRTIGADAQADSTRSAVAAALELVK